MVKTARTKPTVFFATCARLIGPEVNLTIEQSLPGGLDPADWSLLQEVIQAVRAGIPDAANAKPGEVFERVLSALRAAVSTGRVISPLWGVQFSSVGGGDQAFE